MSHKPKESVWDYPRPPRVEAYPGLIEVVHREVRVVRSQRSLRVLETSHPPAYYIPREDIRMDLLYLTGKKTFCEYKGEAVYWGIHIDGKKKDDVAWSYPKPRPGFEVTRDHLSFYAGKLDACYVEGERVTPQSGGFYGGWITSWITGPFKGGPGTLGW